MPTYITLLNYTQEGVTRMKESPARLDAAKQAFKAAGGELKTFYLTLGQFDAVVIAEGPNDETAARLALMIAGQGAVRTQTFRAFTEDEYRKIVAALP